MENPILTALQESIQKWTLIAKGELPDMGAENCALCDLFFQMNCRGCPVYKRTGKSGCLDTPYGEWFDAAQRGHYEMDVGYIADTPQLVELALAERDFLRSLVPAVRRSA